MVECAKLFISIVRRGRNIISSILDKNRKRWEGDKHLIGIVNEYFQDLFHSENPFITNDLGSLFDKKIDTSTNSTKSLRCSEMRRGVAFLIYLDYHSLKRMVSKHSQKGVFSMRKVYEMDQQHRFKDFNIIWKHIWHPKIQPRVALFLWRCFNDELPIKIKLSFVDVEDGLHLFRDYPFSLYLWYDGMFNCRANCIPRENLKEFLVNLLRSFTGEESHRVLMYVGCQVEEVWTQRNLMRLIGKMYQPGAIIACIDAKFIKMIEVSRERERLELNRVEFSDASWKEGSTRLVVVMIHRISRRWATNSCCTIAYSALDAEIYAMLSALNWAKNEGWNNMAIISDASSAIGAFESRVCPLEWNSWHTSFQWWSYTNVKLWQQSTPKSSNDFCTEFMLIVSDALALQNPREDKLFYCFL
ncbi:hypothetical protein F8388_022378 [Cannabis sativa]|uniref:Reverse transcriptase zinc-binding domain-containing protein n=1 Tax=Cannabis sativa TaxID=3483 RepID=A0A7J6G6U0_CANSA|nr:hypothetical protein F8388_022378 [Cannabis sativa]